MIMRRIALLLLILAIMVLVKQGLGQTGIDARSAGMAFSNVSNTMGAEQVGLNPATLALVQNFKFELNLLSLNVGFINSVKRSLYDRYFTSGDTLYENDVQNILSAIPSSGYEFDFQGRANIFSLYARNLSLSLTGVGSASMSVPKQVFELLLQGNSQLNHTYTLNNFQGSSWGGVSANVSIGIPVKKSEEGPLNLMAIGVTFKYLKGLGYFESLNAEGNLYNYASGISADALMEARVSRGGSGFGLDWGMLLQYNKRLNISILASNILGSINWTQDNERLVLGVQTEDLLFNLDKFALPDFVEDSNYVKTDTSFALSAFTTRLPVQLNLGLGYYVTSRWLITSQFEKSFANRLGYTTRARFSVGTELRYIPLVPVRMGISLGGLWGKALSFGTGLDLKFWYLDAAVINYGGITAKSSRGITLAITSRFRF